VGVAGHRRYSLTQRDLLESNQDLLDYCGQILAATPATDLTVDTDQTTLTITTKGLTLIDIYVDGHPAGPPITPADPTQITMPLPNYEERLEVCGYQGSILRQRRTVQR
jgi:hypothetical protein